MSSFKSNYGNYRGELLGLLADLDDTAVRVVDRTVNVGLNATKKKTPVNKNPKIVGGTLRKAWQKNKIYRIAGRAEGSYSNNTSYGLYVNNGHRIVKNTSQGKVTVGKVEGRYMLEYGIEKANSGIRRIFDEEVERAKKKGGF